MALLANITAIFHGLVMIGLFAGPILMFRKKRNKKLENVFLILAGLTALSFLITGACFLTTLEKNLLIKAGLSAYNSGFVHHYLGVIGINIPDIATTIIISLLVTTVIIRFIWLKYKKREKMSIKITYFVHGTTSDNERSLCTGQFGGELSDRGENENIKLREILKNRKFDAIFTSDLKRAIDSSKTVFPTQKIIIDKRLRECNYGDLNGRPESEFEPEEYYINNSHPNGESYIDVEKRIVDFLGFLKKNYDGKNIAILAHKAPQLALEVLINGKTWQEAIKTDWRQTKSWQPGWGYIV